MHFWNWGVFLLSDGSDRKAILEIDHLLASATGETEGKYHYLLSGVCNQVAKRSRFHRWLRFFERLHLDKALELTEISPGPLGVQAAYEIADGNLVSGLEKLTLELRRRQNWIEHSEHATNADYVHLFGTLKLGGHTLSAIGSYSESRKWLESAKAVFALLSDGDRIEHSEQLEEVILEIQWTYQCELRYSEALLVIDKALDEFSFTSFPSESRKNLMQARRILIEILDSADSFEHLGQDERPSSELIAAIQASCTLENVSRIRREVLIELRKNTLSRRITETGKSAIECLKKQIELNPQTLNIQEPKCNIPQLSSRWNRTQSLPDPEIQALAESLRSTAEKLSERAARLHDAVSQIQLKLNELTNFTSEQAIRQVQSIMQQTKGVPFSHHIKWHLLRTTRFLFLFLGIALIVEQFIEAWVKTGLYDLLGYLKIQHFELIADGCILAVFFVVSKVLEDRIDQFVLERARRMLFLLVMERTRFRWFGYNAILISLSTARDDSLQSV